MTTFFSVDKKELDYDEEVKSQLYSLAQQIDDKDDQYIFQPHEVYKSTFIWVLETNKIPFQVNQVSF
ncbi:hypothetical protein GXP67_32900 [Rhodocytophaga rosea]|uniref:Uncharacterized protein n=1 Tax=Rhodocytophaga rosea TaxID=2704465 RepID=A0A6C0GTH9_9BACT|nr:hypothetical protein [Rhodocytophaga rosea]QHT71114.1 hypothetical protein GXP67_32900 [Rhodocytophaga rosea]